MEFSNLNIMQQYDHPKSLTLSSTNNEDDEKNHLIKN